MPDKIWKSGDIPRREELAEYLNRIQAVRNIFPGLPDLPEVPPDMNNFNYERANDLERILVQVNSAVNQLETSFIQCGELQSGGV